MTRPRHLVSVWNPAYATDAMDAHINVLIDRARAHREGRLESEDEVHVWWGRITSPRRKEPLPHLADVLELDRQIKDGTPTYLYLTDYHSLYVADMSEVTVSDVRAKGAVGIPAYYKELDCDVWFGVWDIRRLVAQDTRAVIQELRKLHNTRYHDQPVSLYGGITELPLIVWRATEMDWFGGHAELTEGRLWAERDAELRGEVGRLSADLRDNLFGDRIWHLMEPATRTFLASAEAVVRTRRDDPAFDFSGAAVEYAKALETEVNAVLRVLMQRAYAGTDINKRMAIVDGRPVDLGTAFPHQSIGALRRLLEEEPLVKRGIERVAASHVKYVTDEYKLPRQLEKVRELRNPARACRPCWTGGGPAAKRRIDGDWIDRSFGGLGAAEGVNRAEQGRSHVPQVPCPRLDLDLRWRRVAAARAHFFWVVGRQGPTFRIDSIPTLFARRLHGAVLVVGHLGVAQSLATPDPPAPDAMPGSANEDLPERTPASLREWIGRLEYEPKRQYAVAYIRSRLLKEGVPADPGRRWATKVRRRVDKLLGEHDPQKPDEQPGFWSRVGRKGSPNPVGRRGRASKPRARQGRTAPAHAITDLLVELFRKDRS